MKLCSEPSVAGSRSDVETPGELVAGARVLSVAMRAFIASNALLKASAASAPAVAAG